MFVFGLQLLVEIDNVNVSTTITEALTDWELECMKVNSTGKTLATSCFWNDRDTILDSLTFNSGYDDAVVFTLIMTFFVFGLVTIPAICVMTVWWTNMCMKKRRRMQAVLRRATVTQNRNQNGNGNGNGNDNPEEGNQENVEKEEKPFIEEIVGKNFVLRMSRLLLAPKRSNYKRNRYKRTLIEVVIRNSVVDCGKNMNPMFVGKLIAFGKDKQTLHKEDNYDLDQFVHQAYLECSEHWNSKKSQFDVWTRDEKEAEKEQEIEGIEEEKVNEMEIIEIGENENGIGNENENDGQQLRNEEEVGQEEHECQNVGKEEDPIQPLPQRCDPLEQYETA